MYGYSNTVATLILNAVLEEEDIRSIVTNGLERAVGVAAVSSVGKLTTTWGELKVE